MKRPFAHEPEEIESTLFLQGIQNHLLKSERFRLYNQIINLQDQIKSSKRQLKKQKLLSEEVVKRISNVALLCDKENDKTKGKLAVQSILNEFVSETKNNKKPTEEIKKKISTQETMLLLQRSEINRQPCSKTPLKILKVSLQQQYMLTKKETLLLSLEEKEKLVPSSVRIMGGGKNLNDIYIVAKDLCLLIEIRKGNVAKALTVVNQNEKFHMAAPCSDTNGLIKSQKVTVLTVFGVIRLLKNSLSKNGKSFRLFSLVLFFCFFSFTSRKMDL